MIPSNIRGKTFKGNVNCVNRDGAMMLRNGTGTMKSILCSLVKGILFFMCQQVGPLCVFSKYKRLCLE